MLLTLTAVFWAKVCLCRAKTTSMMPSRRTSSFTNLLLQMNTPAVTPHAPAAPPQGRALPLGNASPGAASTRNKHCIIEHDTKHMHTEQACGSNSRLRMSLSRPPRHMISRVTVIAGRVLLVWACTRVAPMLARLSARQKKRVESTPSAGHCGRYY